MTDFLQQLGADLDEAAGRRASRRRRPRLVRGTIAVCAVVAAVAGVLLLTDQDRQGAGEREAANDRQIPPTALAPAQPVSCEIGARPEYFVPGDSSVALVGCVRLPVSEKRLDFSVKSARLDGAEHLCVNPAYGGGQFIPAICKLEPPAPRFAVRDARQPREGYGYVIWGTAGDARSVRASFEGGTADAAVIDVPADIARGYGENPFKLFVVELPLTAACGEVNVDAGDASATVEPQPMTCP